MIHLPTLLTQIAVILLAGFEMWGYCALVLSIAVAGKFGGVSAAARFSGLPWRGPARSGRS